MRDEEGMVTVEAALALTGVILVLVMVLAAIGSVRNQSVLCQAVREGARAEAMGESGELAAQVAFPSGASFQVAEKGMWVEVTGTAPALGLGGLSIGELECSATVLSEVNW